MDDEDAVLYSFTATHAGAFTKLCRQGPGLYRSIWHLIGIKLWVVWPSTSYNDNETRNCAEKEFSIRWAIKHLHDAEVYFCNEPCSFIISPNSWYSNLSFMPSVHFSSLFIQSDKLDDMAKNTKTWAENLRHRDACQTWSPEGWQQARESVQESYDLCTKLAAETDNYESLYKWIGLCVEEHENPFRKQFQSSAMSNKDAVLEDQPGGVSPARRKRDGEEEEEGIWTPRKRTKAQ
ncbi:hypothetical protein FRB91_005951 [Serendipita sp. 411]|nr:hypothetical protein FRB91_005951 [Serendipita sp. 411]